MRMSIDAVKLNERLGKVIDGMSGIKMRFLLNDITSTLAIEMRDNFKAGGTKIFGQWAPLKTSTIRDKQSRGYGGKPILVRTGTLMKSIRPNDVREDYAEVGSFGVGFAIYHQTGTKNMPARKIIGVGENGKRLMGGLIEKFIRKLLYT